MAGYLLVEPSGGASATRGDDAGAAHHAAR
jgi:hypothetical protein